MERLKVKKIFITGSSGFIGRNLKEYLQKKFTVFAPSHKQLNLLDADKVRIYILKNKINVILHCALIGGGKEDLEIKDIVYSNLRIFFNITRNSKLVDKIIHFGSGLEYDKNRPLKSVKEEDFDKKIPMDEYGFYKYVCAKYSENSQNIYDLVIFGIYGKYEDYLYRFISNSIIKNLLKMPIVINQNVVFDYLYINDLVKIVGYFISHKPKYKIFNLTSGKKIDLLSIAKLINSVGEFKSEIKILNKGLNNEYTASNNRLLKELTGFKFTPHRDTIKELYNWYKNRMHLNENNKIKQDSHIKFLNIHKSLYK
ncbi:sugar epimerase [Candidatus Roizmanbacteria bacterium RIFCSPLOWO2_01_FULL_37_12]|uniref:Sugar epimerase n=1 Tax=Candidatus Roizmanbacteria bacterium RIFCSPLOWO2_01_FULL_37_12 TaxID=1802056 RepID=A0A1F7IFK8_9BACT|nr:MAG: sugar epimerase [Candidatus Roizmanbacteria bacterium RIFCSPHIGHO2_02_FULL_37_9b]OGK42159.1 MAG: sugar epimerase [Candidatus Roizmanbacteria bacterium RIFCSPLOWO2_01_FULL_37_12]